MAYAAICADGKAAIAIGVRQRAVPWLLSVTLPSNEWCPTWLGLQVLSRGSLLGSAYHSEADPPVACSSNGKIERFHRALADDWATHGSGRVLTCTDAHR
ncbi:hypothetical protein A5731_11860 [Mycolicibacterium conceptionense]|nr:hypothetical protein A5718_19030 [Mycolicibacterium conceptionense]OBF04595.1 hypothetical protein A5731_11860 [Mycolicibacterium conceptionense]OBF17018.1 hypothetical protein A5726_20570 [Mycolicibacterium conceptionense]OBF43008.1 hypothetical protein A5720_13980 [Mycolicibacterium conceptionense]OBI00827.1 hypothetical protein A5716_07680 [Mycolicibacterium conceptionense]